MVKKILSLIICCALLACVGTLVFAQTSETRYVIDYAGLLTTDEIAQLESELSSLSARHNCDVVVLTTYDKGGKTSEEYADDFFDYGGYGRGADGAGVILLIDMEDRYVHISTSGYCIDAIYDDAIDDILNYVADKMGDGDVYGAVDEFAGGVNWYLTNYTPVDPEPPRELTLKEKLILLLQRVGLIAGGAGAIAGGITTGSLQRELKSVSKKGAANDYISGGLKLTQHNDIYLYSHTASHRKMQEQPRSTGSTHVSTTHVSSSGKTHGGGGKHF